MALSKTQRLVEDLKALIRRETRLKAGLPLPATRDEIPVGRGVGQATAKAKSSGGGIASPLTEKPGKRTHYLERYLYSTDGIFAIAHQPALKAVFADAVGHEVTFLYADPDA